MIGGLCKARWVAKENSAAEGEISDSATAAERLQQVFESVVGNVLCNYKPLSPISLTLNQLMQQVEKRNSYKNDNRDHGVSFFFVIHFGDQVAGGDIEGDAGREGQCITNRIF